jgi:ABC-2 type transport system permease protein
MTTHPPTTSDSATNGGPATPGGPPARMTFAGAERGRPVAKAARSAFAALIQRDLTVLRKDWKVFVGRTIIQPFLLVFVFTYVFPKIGQGIGGGGGSGSESDFATVLVAGIVGLTIFFQGVQAVALTMSTEFGYTKEIEDRVLAPMPVWMVAVGKVASASVQGIIAALIVFPIAALIHAKGVTPHLSVHWPILLTMLPLACVMCSSIGLTLGTRIEPRNIAAMFGFIILPVTFLGGTYYPWVSLEHVKVGGWAWLQTLVCANPLIYVTEGFRAALTKSPHMHLYVVYPVLIGWCVLFLYFGLKGFRRRVLA